MRARRVCAIVLALFAFLVWSVFVLARFGVAFGQVVQAPGEVGPLEGMTAEDRIGVCMDSETHEINFCVTWTKVDDPPNISYLGLLSDNYDLLVVYRVDRNTRDVTIIWRAPVAGEYQL